MTAKFGGWINTYSGHQFFPLDPDPGVIAIEDIAHALSNLCRYNGHTPRFYSVAEHCARLAAFADETDRELARYLLLHDASEAYLADIPRPLKGLPCFAEYLEYEKRLQATIYRRFGLDPAREPAAVRAMDTAILGDEAPALFGDRMHAEWKPPAPLGFDNLRPGLAERLPWGWPAETAEGLFLLLHRRFFLEMS